jgi:peptidyl-prolyl cis-trans isomerase SurA
MKKNLKILLILCIFSVGAAPKTEVVDKIAAVVGDQVITLNELELAYKNDELGLFLEGGAKISKREYLDRMVEKMVVQQEIKRQGVTVSAQEIEQAIDKKRAQFGLTPAAFVRALRDQGVTLDAYREQTRQSLVLAKLVAKEVKSSMDITDQEIASFYEQHKDQLLSQDKVHLYHIVIREGMDASQKIKTVQEQFAQGTPFPDLARKYSEGEEAQKGGDLGWVDTETLKVELRIMIGKLKIGDISPVYRDEVGYHLFWVQGMEKGVPLSLEQSKESIRQVIYQKQFQEQYQIWMERLKTKTYVDIRL